MNSLRRHEGYLLIDHRASPGVSEDFIRSTRKAALTAPEGALAEAATFTCCHCQAVVVVNRKRTRPRGYCAKCDHLVCDNPICSKECMPFAKILDVAEKEARLIISV